MLHDAPVFIGARCMFTGLIIGRSTSPIFNKCQNSLTTFVLSRLNPFAVPSQHSTKFLYIRTLRCLRPINPILNSSSFLIRLRPIRVRAVLVTTAGSVAERHLPRVVARTVYLLAFGSRPQSPVGGQSMF